MKTGEMSLKTRELADLVEDARIWLAIKLRNMAYWLLGQEHVGGGWNGVYYTHYARSRTHPTPLGH